LPYTTLFRSRRLTAAEVFKQLGRLRRSALAENFAQEAFSCFTVENAFFFKARISIGAQHLGPFVAVVTGGVTTSKNMGKAVLEAVEFHHRHHRHQLAHFV